MECLSCLQHLQDTMCLVLAVITAALPQPPPNTSPSTSQPPMLLIGIQASKQKWRAGNQACKWDNYISDRWPFLPPIRYHLTHMVHTDMIIAITGWPCIFQYLIKTNKCVSPSITVIFLAALFHQSVYPPLQRTCPDLCDRWAADPLAECD